MEEGDGEDGENDLALEDSSVGYGALRPFELEENKDGEEKDSEDDQDDLDARGKRPRRDPVRSWNAEFLPGKKMTHYCSRAPRSASSLSVRGTSEVGSDGNERDGRRQDQQTDELSTTEERRNARCQRLEEQMTSLIRVGK